MARSERITTPEFRVSYPAVLKAAPNRVDPSKPDSYGCALVFPPGTDLSALKEMAKGVVKAQWGDNPPANLKDPFLDAHEKDKGQGNFEKGSVLVRTSSQQRRPGLVDAQMNDIIDENEFYAGCYARASINCYAWTVNTGSGVSFGLINVQKTRDGQPIGFSANPQDDFEAIDPESLGGEAPIGEPAAAPAAATPSFMD